MKPDDVIAARKEWTRAVETMTIAARGFTQLPKATVLAERDWIAYVLAMADAVPDVADLDLPGPEDVRWAWPDGVCVVFDEPIEIEHVIVSKDTPYGGLEYVASPGVEKHVVRGLAIGAPQTMPARLRAGPVELADAVAALNYEVELPGDKVTEVTSYPMVWFGLDANDCVTGKWIPGVRLHAVHAERVSQASRLLLSIITALGHRLTRIEPPVTANRGERRRIHRDVPSLRVLKLGTGATVKRDDGRTGTVDWQRRWIVRGHWRLQPYGPQRSLRKPLWIDPFVKGPEDKPLDSRDTIWRTPPPA